MTSVYEPGGLEQDVNGRDGCDAGRGPDGNEVELVLLTSVWDPLEAEMIAGKLRSAGIDVYVRHEALSVVYGLTLDGAGQQDIMVRAEDLDDARAAIDPEP